MTKKMLIKAAKRLKADAKETLIQQVEKILNKYNIKRHQQMYPNPRQYRKKAEESLLDEVQESLQELGFKFNRLPIHTQNTKAVESEGVYRAVDYILDLVFRHDELEVDLYF